MWSGFYTVYTYAICDERTTYVSPKGIFFLYGTTNDKTAMLHAKQCNFRSPCVHTLQQCRVHALDLPFGGVAFCKMHMPLLVRCRCRPADNALRRCPPKIFDFYVNELPIEDTMSRGERNIVRPRHTGRASRRASAVCKPN
jgi:hypothetical protein